MPRSNSKSLGNHIVSPEEEKERLKWEGIAEKKGFQSGMKSRVNDGKLIIISITILLRSASSFNKNFISRHLDIIALKEVTVSCDHLGALKNL